MIDRIAIERDIEHATALAAGRTGSVGDVGWWVAATTELLSRLTHALTEVAAARAAIEDGVAGAKARLVALAADPPPLLGSSDAAALASEVRRIEQTIADAPVQLAAIDALQPMRDLIDQARRGAANCLPRLLERAAHEAVDRITRAIRHDLATATALAQTIGQALDRYAATVAQAEALAGQALAAPVIVFPDRAAWEVVAAGRTPTIGAPGGSTPPRAGRPGIAARVRQAITGTPAESPEAA